MTEAAVNDTREASTAARQAFADARTGREGKDGRERRLPGSRGRAASRTSKKRLRRPIRTGAPRACTPVAGGSVIAGAPKDLILASPRGESFPEERQGRRQAGPGPEPVEERKAA